MQSWLTIILSGRQASADGLPIATTFASAQAMVARW